MYQQITFNDQLMLREIIQRALGEDTAWLKENNISVSPKKDYLMLNYGVGDPTECSNLVRGMIVNLDGEIIGFPFTRFFNYGDPRAAEIKDLKHFDVLEKLDGCFVSLCYDRRKEEWLFGTRRMLSSHQPDFDICVNGFNGQSYYLMREISLYIDELLYKSAPILGANDHITYCFEFIHPSTKILTQYEPADYGLYLIGARSLTDYNEFTENVLNLISSQIGTQRPRIFEADCFDKVYDLMQLEEKITKNFEGFIFRDKITSKRVKLKSKEYVKLHCLIGQSSPSSLLVNILSNQVDDLIVHFPHLQTEVIALENRLHEFINAAYNNTVYFLTKYVKSNLSYKDLWALMVENKVDDYTKSQIMNFARLGKDVSYEDISDNVRGLHINKLVKLLDF